MIVKRFSVRSGALPFPFRGLWFPRDGCAARAGCDRSGARERVGCGLRLDEREGDLAGGRLVVAMIAIAFFGM